MPVSSWLIFRHLNIFNHHPIERHPVYRRESGRVVDWTHYTEPAMRVLFPVMSGFAALYLLLSWTHSPWLTMLNTMAYWAILVLALLPSLAPWSLPIGVLVGPSVAEELEHKTWSVLRVIPAGIAPVLLAKARAGLWPLRHPLHIVRHLWLVEALIVGVGLLQAGQNAWSDTNPLALPLCAPGEWTFIASVGLLLGGGAIFFVDRIQQITLMTVTALAVSTTARSSQWGLVGAVTAAFFVWALETASAFVLLIILSGNAVLRTLNVVGLIILGPLGGYAIDLALGPALTGIALTLIAREIAIRGLWWWSVRAAAAE
jgi:hypothetical protein